MLIRLEQLHFYNVLDISDFLHLFVSFDALIISESLHLLKLSMPKVHVNLTNQGNNLLHFNIAPGDTVVYTCPYTVNGDMQHICPRERELFERKLFCFENVLVNRNVFPLRDYVRGAYNITSETVDNVYTSEFTVPPVVLMNRHFECYCFMDDNNRVIKRTVKINISKGIARKIPGCDFNDEYREITAITTFSNMNRRRVKVCDSYPKGGDTIVLLCPVNYTVQPEGCFNQVYVKKDEFKNEKNKLEERFNISRKWEEHKHKIIDVEALFGQRLTIMGDKMTKFAKIPVTNEEISFTCTCQADDGADTLMMNVYINESYDKFVNSNSNNNKVEEHSKHTFSSTTETKVEERSVASSSFFAQALLCALSLLLLSV
ncbi:hypothetical protein C922_01222 [Plasmodium inui San Antonio 1]|uniref:6-Cys domain-containing protein n=1 Tax=Plasmodium inui San Antonio 1 TaxID=1237626 RepID=W7AGQ9_9APIC|nr:hypothetical protein C922_01222 [Plasmodium inui San Antonio 1]EUD68204.1 hypothetical protein C922_01222 [Plasmodium inui San Antonio 1]